MIGSEILTRFEMQADDTSELSSDEELQILNRVYRNVLNAKTWEFLKKAFAGTTDSNSYISLPADFAYITANANYTDSSEPASRPVVFVGPNYSPYQVISWSDRRQYRDQDGYCYVDIVNSRLVFTKQQTAGLAVEFDYVYRPDDITLVTSPVFPADYHEILVFGMMFEDQIIQQSDKAKNYASENIALYKNKYNDMCYWNSQLIQM